MENRVLDAFLNRAELVMKLLGVWVPDENETTAQKCYKCFTFFLQYSFLFFQIVYVIQVWGDIDAVSRAVYLLFTQASLCFKISVFHWNIGLVRKLLEQMCCETFQPLSDFHERILKARAKYIKRLLLMFIIAAETTCLTWGLNPLFDSGARKFPFDMWMPISPEKDSFYAIGFLYQEITICMSALLYYGVDSVAISMVIFACAQLEIIMEKILSIQSYRPSVDDMTVEEYYTNANNKLIECVKHYHAVVRFTKLIEDTFHVYIFFQLTGAVGIIVMSAYRILILESQSIELIATMMYLTGMASQIYISCWSGHELTYLSEKLHTVLYMCAWYEQDLKFQRALYLTMLRVRHPLVLRAGHYISLSRQTFVAILRTSYSYFAVLNRAK